MTEAIYEDVEIARQREAIVPLKRIGRLTMSRGLFNS